MRHVSTSGYVRADRRTIFYDPRRYARQQTLVSNRSGFRTGQTHFYLFSGEGEIPTRERVVPSPVSPALYTAGFGTRVRRCRSTPVCRDRSTSAASRRGLPGVLSPSRAKRPDTYSGPTSSASRCSDRGVVQAP